MTASVETQRDAGSVRHVLDRDGIVTVAAFIDGDEIAALAGDLASRALCSAGTRTVLRVPRVRALAAACRAHAVVGAALPPDAVAVQCTLFEKSAARNWLVTPHQDLSIPVRERIEHPALGAWSRKEGVTMVQAPADLLASMTAVRVHLDDCAPEHGPLRVVPGSHRHGVLDTHATAQLVAARGERACPVPAGGALLMKPLVVHASSKAMRPNRRRVLHFLFGPRLLPYGLEWHDSV